VWQRIWHLAVRWWLTICVLSLSATGLLAWGALWFGLSSQCGGGYGSCTSLFHQITVPMAFLCLVAGFLTALLALVSLLRALILAVR
jgi:hypothetical protein